jgi:predicted transcriptional regulator
MEVQFTPEQEAQLSKIANSVGTDAEHLVQDAALRLLKEEARFIDAVKLGEAELERGEYLSSEEVGARLERLFQS